MSNKQTKNKSLIEKLKELEEKQIYAEDVVTLQQARYLIDRICKAVSEET